MNDPSETRRRALFFANGGSRRRGEAVRAVELLRAAGFALEEPVLAAASHEEILARTSAAVADGVPLVIVGGGDGTFTSIVGSLAHGRTALGVLPLGTGNSFARSLHIPLDLEGAIETIARGREARVDLGRLGERYFANFATIGFTSNIGHDADSPVKRALGTIAYVASGAKVAAEAEPFRLTCEMPGREPFAAETYQAVVVAGRVFGTTPIDPEASAADGLLDLFVHEDASKLDVVATFFAFLAERQHELPGAHRLAAARMRIDADPPQNVNVDGEAAGSTPAEFAIDAGALRVLVPDGRVR